MDEVPEQPNLPLDLPTIYTPETPLPALYLAAVRSLEECVRVDECKHMADKAMALQMYAKMAENPILENHAKKIRARAVIRAGQLIKECNQQGQRNDLQLRRGDSPKSNGSYQAGAEAGLSRDQVKQYIAASNVPPEQLDALIESDNPPSITKLAQMGRKPREQPESRTETSVYSTPQIVTFEEAKNDMYRTVIAAVSVSMNRMRPQMGKGGKERLTIYATKLIPRLRSALSEWQ